MDIYKLKFTILELELLSYFCIKTGEEFSQREIAQMLKVSPTAIGNTVKLLVEKDLVKVKKTKTINFVKFNRENYKAIELKRVENLRMIYVSGISDFLENNFPGTTIILFGSYARGEDIYSSDIDIAIIGGKDKVLNLDPFEKLVKREININFYSSWKDIHKNLKNNILNGIILAGSVEL